jgi:GT2 family glycosyltransferase
VIDLSIIIVSWNTREILRDCLQSVVDRLGRLRAELFVVDNASHDQSAEMVADEFPKCRLLANTKNLGFAAANNHWRPALTCSC